MDIWCGSKEGYRYSKVFTFAFNADVFWQCYSKKALFEPHIHRLSRHNPGFGFPLNLGLTPSKTLLKINILQTNFAQQKNSISIMH
jgi:hypothetical protein